MEKTYSLNVDDIVTRKSHNHDIIFRIKTIDGFICLLEGVFERLIADAPMEDLELVNDGKFRDKVESEKKLEEEIISKFKKNNNYLYGKILHIDADVKYLKKSSRLYDLVSIYAKCVHLPEDEVEHKILDMVESFLPDIVVITGHDSYNNKGLKNLDNYMNSRYFFNACRAIRSRYSKDHVFLIAGACQSNFEALIAGGCNFAMSRERVNIQALDPAIIAIKAATTPFNKIIFPKDVYSFTTIKKEGIGGIESFGKMRLLF